MLNKNSSITVIVIVLVISAIAIFLLFNSKKNNISTVVRKNTVQVQQKSKRRIESFSVSVYLGQSLVKEINQDDLRKLSFGRHRPIVKIKSLFESLKIKGDKVQFLGASGEKIEFAFGEISGERPLALSTTNVPSLKLFKMKSPTATSTMGYLIRDVSKIIVLAKGDYTASNSSSLQCSNRQVYTQLSSALANADKVCILNLGNQNLATISADFVKFVNLDTLNLGHNRLSVLPPVLFKLKITSLNIDSNGIDEIPREIGEISTLKILKIGRNHIRSLPAEIALLSNLEILEAENNQLTTLPVKIRDLRNLKTLDLKDNNFSSAEQSKIKAFFPQAEVEF